MITRAMVLDALADVRDPELDEPLTELGFVAEVRVAGRAVDVRLRLPTYFCAPGFAYLMVDDARDAVLRLPGAGAVTVTLDDHFAAGEITTAVGAGAGFAGAFPGESAGELPALRQLFARKAFVARQSAVADGLLRAGRTRDELTALRLGELRPDPDVCRCIELRARLGLDVSPAAAAFVLADGSPLDAAGLSRFLRVARLVRLSLEGNAGLCRSLLATRYGVAEPQTA